MTWGDASDFCQSRGLTLVSPASADNGDVMNNLGAKLKSGGGFWTDGYVSHPTSNK